MGLKRVLLKVMPMRRPARSTHPPLSTAHKVVQGNYYLRRNYYLLRSYSRSTHPPLSTSQKGARGNYYLRRNYSLHWRHSAPSGYSNSQKSASFSLQEIIIYVEIILYTQPPLATQILKSRSPEIFATSSHHMTYTYPPPLMTYMYPPPHMTSSHHMTTFQNASSTHPPPSVKFFF
jgi:hypothetical protein